MATLKPSWAPLLCCLLVSAGGSAWADNRGGMARPAGVPGGVSTPWPMPRTPGPAVERPTPLPRDLPAREQAAREAPVRDAAPEAPPNGREDVSARRDPDSRDARPPLAAVAESRAQRAERLVTLQPLLYERDPAGAPVRRAELTLLLAAQATLPASLLARGFVLVRETEVFGRRLVVLRAPADLPLPAALDLGRQLAPEAEVDFNHVLLGSGAARQAASAAPSAAPPAGQGDAVHVGLIDEAVSADPAVGELQTEGRTCRAATTLLGHGQAVAQVLARQLREAGRRPLLHAADIGCGQGAVDAMAAALQAMDASGVPVVNVSAVGPHNRVLAAVVTAFLTRGHLLVAAVGNDGPAAPPLFPAAYPGVVAVTAVDRAGHVLPEAGRGDHVAFAAPGLVELPQADGHLRGWRGTSFAAPVVAAELALRLPKADTRAAAAAVAALARSAVDAGEPGRDRIYGHGVIGLPATALAGLR